MIPISFTELYIRGFGSIVKPLQYQLDRGGINVLQARNGIGKTTLFSALSWVLYGKTLKNKSSVQTWQRLRDKDFQGTKVSVIFYKGKVEYQVIRYEKWKDKHMQKRESGLVFKIDGSPTKSKYKGDVQKDIIKVLGFSLELFKNSVIFGQKMKRIIEEDGPTKKKVFDEAFDIGYIQIAKEKVQEKSEILLKEINDFKTDLKAKEEIYKELTYAYENTNKIIREFEQKKITNLRKLSKAILIQREKILELRVKIDKLGNIKEKINNLQNKLKKILKKRDKQNIISNKHFTLDMELQNIKGKILDEKAIQKNSMESLSKVINKCPRCGQQLTPEHIKKEKAKIKNEVETSKKRMAILNESLIEPEKIFNGYTKYLEFTKNIPVKIRKATAKLELALNEERDLLSLGYMLEAAEGELYRLRDEKKNLKASELIFDHGEQQVKVGKVKTKIDTINKILGSRQKAYDINTWLIKEPLSNSGIKAFIFNQMLSLVNERLKLYCNELGFDITFNIDLESANKDFYIIITNQGESTFYEDLSGGEQQLTNICIAFAIHDVICMDKNINILIFDEVFESLDSGNVEVVANLINLKAQEKKCIHLITHHKDFNPTNAHIIPIYKKKGRTYLQQ